MFKTTLLMGAKFLGKEIGKEAATTVITAAGAVVLSKVGFRSKRNSDGEMSVEDAFELLREMRSGLPSEPEVSWTQEQLSGVSDEEFISVVRRMLESEAGGIKDSGSVVALGQKTVPTNYVLTEEDTSAHYAFVRVAREEEAILNAAPEALHNVMTNARDLFDVHPPMSVLITATPLDDLTIMKYLTDTGVLVLCGDDLRATLTNCGITPDNGFTTDT